MRKTTDTLVRPPVQDNYRDVLRRVRDETIEAVKLTKRLEQSDREAFSRNLGRMFLDLQYDDPEFNFARLFDAAFPSKATSISLLKKRKTLLLLPSEDENTEGLKASPNHYLELARTFDRYYKKYRNTDDQYAFLKLVEGSSFDPQDSEKSRRKIKERADLKSTLEKCVRDVRSRVNLNWMYEYLECHSLKTIGGTGNVDGFLNAETRGGIIALMRFDENERFNNAIAPSIRLQRKFRKLEAESVYKLPAQNSGSLRESMIQTLNQFLNNAESTIFTGIDLFEHYSSITADEAFRELNRIMDDSGYNLEAIPTYIEIEKFLDLEILFHQESSEWLPYLLERYDLSSENQCYDQDYRVVNLRTFDDTSDVFFLDIIVGDDDYKVFSFRWEDNNGESYFCYFLNDLGPRLEDDFTYAMSVPFVPYNEEYFERFYQRLHDRENGWEIENLFTSNNSDFVDQPQGTLAQSFLQNILYFNNDERLPELLVADAERKFKLLKNFADEHSDAYNARLKEFLNK